MTAYLETKFRGRLYGPASGITLAHLQDSENKTKLFRSDLLQVTEHHAGESVPLFEGSDSRSCCFHIETLHGKVRSMLVQLPKGVFPGALPPLNPEQFQLCCAPVFLLSGLGTGECRAFCSYFHFPNAELAVILLLGHRLACLDAAISATFFHQKILVLSPNLQSFFFQ